MSSLFKPSAAAIGFVVALVGTLVLMGLGIEIPQAWWPILASGGMWAWKMVNGANVR